MSHFNLDLQGEENNMFRDLLSEYRLYRGSIKKYSNEALELIWTYLKPFYNERMGLNRVVETISEVGFEEITLERLNERYALESNILDTKTFLENLKKTHLVLSNKDNNLFVIVKLNKDGRVEAQSDKRNVRTS